MTTHLKLTFHERKRTTATVTTSRTNVFSNVTFKKSPWLHAFNRNKVGETDLTGGSCRWRCYHFVVLCYRLLSTDDDSNLSDIFVYNFLSIFFPVQIGIISTDKQQKSENNTLNLEPNPCERTVFVFFSI